MIPFFVFYSMFGFHRLGDLIWALGDMRGRGFLMAATAGRTTLQGEGLQHCDGHSHAWAATVPNCRAYDPAFAYELAVIVDDGMRRMYGEAPEDVFYYITLYNETYPMPPMPDGVEDGIVRGLYRYRPAAEPAGPSCPRSSPAAQRCWPRSKPNACWPTTTTSPPTCGARPATSSCATTRSASSDGTGCTPPTRHDGRTSPRRSPMSTGRSWQSPTSSRPCPTRSPVGSPNPSSRSAPTDSGSPTPAAPCASTSRWMPRHIVVAALDGLAQQGELANDVVAAAINHYGIDADAPDPRDA